MKSLRDYWYAVTHIGADWTMTYIEVKRVHMVNLIALVCIPFMLYFSYINLTQDRYILAGINLANVTGCVLVLLFQLWNKHVIAKILLLTSAYIFFLAGAVLFQNAGEYYLICILIVAMLLYDDRRIHFIVGFAVISAIIYIEVTPPFAFFTNPVPKSRVFFNVFGSLSFVLVSVNFFIQIIYNNMQKIEDQRVRLQSSNQDKEKIFSIIAHDVKAPFSILESMVSILRDQVVSNSVSPDFIDQLHQRIIQQNRTLDDLLQWGSSNLRGITKSATDVLIKPLLYDIASSFSEQLQLKEVDIDIHIAEDSQVFVNIDHLTIILRNLISNAIKFSHTKGKIEIFTSFDQQRTFIHIKDYGIGMNDSKASLLFRTIQHRSLGTTDEPGAGLGLVLCSDLIEQNGGIVSIESAPEKGSMFTVGLPTTAFAKHDPKGSNITQFKNTVSKLAVNNPH